MCCIQVGAAAIPSGDSERAMRIVDIVADLAAHDEELTIYAKEPWSCDSEAVLAREPDAGGLPPEAAAIGATYFIEVESAVGALPSDYRRWVARYGAVRACPSCSVIFGRTGFQTRYMATQARHTRRGCIEA
jgi:hypothetical protein